MQSSAIGHDRRVPGLRHGFDILIRKTSVEPIIGCPAAQRVIDRRSITLARMMLIKISTLPSRKETMRLLALLLLLSVLQPAASRAQASGPSILLGGGHLLVAHPVGQFAENVDFGFGLGLHGGVRADDAGNLRLRLDFGFINYGTETIRICVTLPCRVTGDLTTSNNILLVGIGPEIAGGSGPLRLYANGSAGLAYFATTSSVEGTSDVEPFASSTNFDDVTFAWTAGSGLRYQVWAGERALVSLDGFARYHGNGDARYLRKGDIHDQPDGSVVLNPQHSETNFWTIGLGVSVRW